MSVCFTRIAIAASLLFMGCDKDVVTGLNGTVPSAPGDLNASLASVPAGSVVSGFKHGRLRQEIDVVGFSISKQPITVGQYRTCMDANVCTTPAHECANVAGTESNGSDSDGAARDAALCVGEDNARAYCAWSGGRLPTLSEWLFAARGPSPQRFSWGDGSASCEQHPLAREGARASTEAVPAGTGPAEAGCAEPHARRFEVGQHSAGASPFGLEDVLIAKAELLGGFPENHFSVCESSEHGCVVYGLMPGAIDAVRPTDEAREAAIAHPYAFRCAWSEEGS